MRAPAPDTGDPANPPGREAPERITQRLTDLQIKASFTEDTLCRPTTVGLRRQQQIDALLHPLAQLPQRAATHPLAMRMARRKDQMQTLDRVRLVKRLGALRPAALDAALQALQALQAMFVP